jgi:hypothetical protein
MREVQNCINENEKYMEYFNQSISVWPTMN